MPGIAVPEPFRAGFRKLIEFNDDDMQRLLAAVNSEGATLLPRQWMGKVSSRASTLPRADVESVIESALSLFSVRSYLSMTTEEFAQAIAESSDLDIEPDRRPIFVHRLVSLLTAEPLFVTSKALEIRTEEAKTFHDARIITEIRPNFHDDARLRPAAVSIVHHLRISYHEDAETRSFYVLLSENGERKLQEALARAAEKGGH